MPQTKYELNKKSIYRWREKNNETQNAIRMRYHYKSKIKDKVWAQVSYEFLDILRER